MSILPPAVALRFATVPANPRESNLYGPYNKLLSAFFPPDTKYTVAPQLYTPKSQQPADFAFEVFLEDDPVFVLGIREPGAIDLPSTREEADNHIRRHMVDLAPRCPLPTLRAVSAIGTRLAFYTFDKHTCILLPCAPADPEVGIDAVPPSRWDCELLEDEGAGRFKAFINAVKADSKEILEG